MHKDVGPKPMEPFTLEEEKGLVERLDALPLAALESYVASARAALENKTLAPTWRPRIEFGARTKQIFDTLRDDGKPAIIFASHAG